MSNTSKVNIIAIQNDNIITIKFNAGSDVDREIEAASEFMDVVGTLIHKRNSVNSEDTESMDFDIIED